MFNKIIVNCIHFNITIWEPFHNFCRKLLIMNRFIKPLHRIKHFKFYSFWINIWKIKKSNLSIKHCHISHNLKEIDIEKIIFKRSNILKILQKIFLQDTNKFIKIFTFSLFLKIILTKKYHFRQKILIKWLNIEGFIKIFIPLKIGDIKIWNQNKF